MGYRKLVPLSACLLCGAAKPLVRSHIVPNFYRRWLRNELGEHPRFLDPNNRVGRYYDDLSKHRMFCRECETLMGRNEDIARMQMLVEWQRPNQSAVAYGPWLARFAASLAMKAAAVHLYTTLPNKTDADRKLPTNKVLVESLPEQQRSDLATAFEGWKRFLLGHGSNPGRNELHLLALDMDHFEGLRGTFGHHHMHTDGFSAVAIFLSGIVVLGLARHDACVLRRSTRIAVRSGTLGRANHEIPRMVLDALERLSFGGLRTREVELQLLAEKNQT